MQQEKEKLEINSTSKILKIKQTQLKKQNRKK